MSVPNQTPYNIYTANGLTTVFAYQFMIMNAGDIEVSINGTPQTSGYTVQGAGQTGGGQVVFMTPPANGSVVMLLRKLVIKRDTDYQDNGDLLAETINADFDRLWLAMQQAFLSDSLSLKRPLLGGPYNAGGLKIVNLQDPTGKQDAATKGWVDLQYSVPTSEAKQAAAEAKEARDETREIADKFGDVDSAITAAENARDEAEASASSAASDATRAEVAATTAEAVVDVEGTYPDIATGIANTAVGKYFRVPQGVGALQAFYYYQNNNGTAQPVAVYAGKAYFDFIYSIISDRLDVINTRTLTRNGVSGFSFPVLAANKRVVGFKDDGGIWGAYLNLPGISSVPPRDAPRMIAVIKSLADGKIGIGFNPKTGLTFALLDDDSVAYIADKIGGGGTTIPDIRGAWGARVFNPRRYIGDDYNTASVLDKGSRTFDARQLRDGVQDTLVMAAPTATAIRIALVYGQSNAGLGGSTGRIVNAAPWAFSTWGFAGVNGSSQQGTVHMSAASLTDFVPALDYSAAQSPAICSAYGITQRNAELGRDDPGYIAATAWHGSQPISSFYPNAQSGYWNYENAVTFLQRAAAIAVEYGRTAILDVMQWIQGEAGPTGRDNYATQLNDLFNTILPGYKAATGQANDVRVAIWQTNMSKAASGENYASQGQWDVANSRADSYLAGPMYQFKLGDEPGTGPSTVHTGPEGRLMLGETYADVYSFIVDKGAWKPVQPVSAVLTGNVVDITFEGTPLDAFGAKLAIDSDWVPDTLNHGFSFPGATITAVEITGAKTVRLTLSAVPAVSNRTLRYAIDAFDDVTYWPTRRGNLMVETDRKSWWNSQGVNIPRNVRHYAIRFEITVTE
ncbi:Uncharacterised protein [Klebsiella pneumoniae]|nr:Uncharacterised protein [Klebsiella pneumoniae]HBY9734803.1 hypothetical protein [Klebsiella pneumoniae]HBY9800096.1 hypothetical protein [Klebsiella pneumoniae]HCI6417983.1 hypothetical protein [Klebsiella pneumoniae]